MTFHIQRYHDRRDSWLRAASGPSPVVECFPALCNEKIPSDVMLTSAGAMIDDPDMCPACRKVFVDQESRRVAAMPMANKKESAVKCVVCQKKKFSSALLLCHDCGESYDQHIAEHNSSTACLLEWAARRARAFAVASTEKEPPKKVPMSVLRGILASVSTLVSNVEAHGHCYPGAHADHKNALSALRWAKAALKDRS